MTYEDKVKLFKAKRFLMPAPPKGTRNWIIRDYIRFIDEYGKWCPEGSEKCELFEAGAVTIQQPRLFRNRESHRSRWPL